MQAKDLVDSAFRLDSDANGNPRYYIPRFLFPPMSEKTRRGLGVSEYRGKRYGPGLVFQSYNLKADVQHLLDAIERDRRP